MNGGGPHTAARSWQVPVWEDRFKRHWSREPPTAGSEPQVRISSCQCSNTSARTADASSRRLSPATESPHVPHARAPISTNCCLGRGWSAPASRRAEAPASRRLAAAAPAVRAARAVRTRTDGVNRTTLRVVIPASRAVCSWDKNVRGAACAGKYQQMFRDPNPEPASPGFHSPMC